MTFLKNNNEIVQIVDANGITPKFAIVNANAIVASGACDKVMI